MYYPTSSIGSNFDDGPWIYKNGLYGTYFHVTPTNRAEAIMQTSCKGTEFNCSLIPRGAEVLRVITDDEGGGTIERLVSTRDSTFTQYNIISSECDDTGPCWAAFQSAWGAIRYNTWIYSDVFISVSVSVVAYLGGG